MISYAIINYDYLVGSAKRSHGISLLNSGEHFFLQSPPQSMPVSYRSCSPLKQGSTKRQLELFEGNTCKTSK